MKKLLLAATALIAVTGSAFAADLPSRRAPPVYIPPPLPTFTWTGFYVGAQVGYEFGRTTDAISGGTGPVQVGETGAVIGGAHVGYLYELGGAGFGGIGSVFGGGLVVGLEGDIEGSNNTSTVLQGALVDQHQGEIEGSVRGRLGIAVDRALFYATGGAAFAQFKDRITNPVGAIFPSSNSRVGYTVGGGVEYAVTPNWSLRAEYRYSDFGNYTNIFAGPAGGGVTFHNVNEQKVELGVSYRFSDLLPAPVVARY